MTPRHAEVNPRLALAAATSEADWERQIRLVWALKGGWCGVHIRKSLSDGRPGFAVLQGVHTLRNSDHEDARGFPDWLFARAGSPLLPIELKTVVGRLDKDQRRWQLVLSQATGVAPGVWRPSDEDLVRRVLLS